MVLILKCSITHYTNTTTHGGDIDNLRVRYPDLTVHESIRWIDEGSVVTSAGISAGIDMSFHLVSRLHSHELARKTAFQMEFDWENNLSAGVLGNIGS